MLIRIGKLLSSGLCPTKHIFSYLTSIFPMNAGNVPQITTLPPHFPYCSLPNHYNVIVPDQLNRWA